MFLPIIELVLLFVMEGLSEPTSESEFESSSCCRFFSSLAVCFCTTCFFMPVLGMTSVVYPLSSAGGRK